MLKFLRRSKKFSANESGSATIEAVLWFPMFVLLLVMVADVSFVFFGQAQAMRILQDGNRAFSVGRITSESDTEVFVVSALAPLTPNPTVTTSLSQGVITTIAEIPVSDLAKIGGFSFLSGYNIIVKSEHFLEY